MALTNKLTAIANAIRAKTGGTATMTLDEMVTEIGSIEGGGGGILEIDIATMIQSGYIPEELAAAFEQDSTVCVINDTTFAVDVRGETYDVSWGDKVILCMPDDETIILTEVGGHYVIMPFPCEYEERSYVPVFTAYTETNFGNDAPCPWGGMNAELVAEYDEQFTLADTSFVIGSSSSTSASTIKASVSNRFTSPTIAIGDKDVVVVQSCKVVPTHNASATGKIQTIAFGAVHVTYISKRKTTDTSGKTTRHPAPYNSSIIKYYTSTGAITRAGANYGFYATMQQASIASTTAASTTVRAGSPALAYRCNSSNYETPANCKCVTDCTWDWHVEVYTVDPFSTVGAAANDVIDELISD